MMMHGKRPFADFKMIPRLGIVDRAFLLSGIAYDDSDSIRNWTDYWRSSNEIINNVMPRRCTLSVCGT